ncbi:MAG: diaminopimelate epimerase [Bacteroidota bacterium]
MFVQFSKYHGTGNDFIMIDGRGQDSSRLDHEAIRTMCSRRFGVGADGLIILGESSKVDFRMQYFNADGHEGTMCGNGGRCITAFASELGIIGMDTKFEGIDGIHTATLLPNREIRLKLNDVNGVRWADDGYLIDTGSPHFVKYVSRVNEMDVEREGSELRNHARFGKDGVNVNFVEVEGNSNKINVRTYERGVEGETYSCGTGVTAAAICSYFHFKTEILSYQVNTLGGKLNVAFKAQHHNRFSDIYLTGPVEKVYEGSIEIGG